MARAPMPTAKFYGFLIIAAVLAFSAAAKVVHPTPKQQLRRRQPAAGKSITASFGAASKSVSASLGVTASFRQDAPAANSEQQEYLKAHNDVRAKMKIPPLAWDAKLAAAAQSWAEKRSRDCDYRSHSNTRYGENIFYMNYREFTPRDVVGWWYNETKMYDAAHLQCRCHPEREGCECGHFLNVVWKTTKRVGCSSAVYCDNQKGVVVVCDYDPAGLVAGVNPFTGQRL